MTLDNFEDMEFLSILEDVGYMKDVYENIIPDIAQCVSDSPASPKKGEVVSKKKQMDDMVSKSQQWDKLMLILRDKLKYQMAAQVREIGAFRQPETPSRWQPAHWWQSRGEKNYYGD